MKDRQAAKVFGEVLTILADEYDAATRETQEDLILELTEKVLAAADGYDFDVDSHCAEPLKRLGYA